MLLESKEEEEVTDKGVGDRQEFGVMDKGLNEWQSIMHSLSFFISLKSNPLNEIRACRL